MKKSLFIFGLAVMLFACNKNSDALELKTAYVNTQKLISEYDETKQIDSKYKIKSEEISKELETEIAKFQKDVEEFQAKAKAKGLQWAQKRGAELQKKEQELAFKQQTIMVSLQNESRAVYDSVIKKIKNQITDYGKNSGYDYIFGTEDISTIFYAKEKFDITDLLIKELNTKYKDETALNSDDSKEEKTK